MKCRVKTDFYFWCFSLLIPIISVLVKSLSATCFGTFGDGLYKDHLCQITFNGEVPLGNFGRMCYREY